MIAECRIKFAVTPKGAKAVLFYSQHPEGRLDHSSLHGSCPVIDGPKWAANLWVWNTVRSVYSGAAENEAVDSKNKGTKKILAHNRSLLTLSNQGKILFKIMLSCTFKKRFGVNMERRPFFCCEYI